MSVKVGYKVQAVNLKGYCNEHLTEGKVYTVTELDTDPDFPGAVFIKGDDGDKNILFKDEYIVVGAEDV